MDQTCPTETINIDEDALRLLLFLQCGGAWGYWWAHPGRRSTWWPTEKPGPLPEGKVNLYFGVHPSAFVPERNDRGEAAEPEYVRSQIASIAAINTLFSEFDAKDFDGDLSKALAHIQNLPLRPSALVCSGGGYHAYWLLSEPHVIRDESERQRLQALQAAWVRFTGGDPGAKDLARVLRVPGTWNYKYDPPRPVTIAWQEYDRLYRLEELEALLPKPRPVPAPRPNGHKPQARFTDQLIEAAALLKRLSPQRCDQYDNWVEVGMALSELGQAGLGLWEDWSKDSPKHQAGECTKKWASFKPGQGIRLASLYHWAEADDPGGGSEHPQGKVSGVEALLAQAAQASAEDFDSQVDQLLQAIAGMPTMRQGRSLRQAERKLHIPIADLRARLRALQSDEVDEEICLAAVKDGKLCFAGECLGNFSARITHELMRDNGQDAPDVRYTIAGQTASGEPLETLEIAAEEFDSAGWLSRWGARVWAHVPPGKMWLIARAMKELSAPALQRQRVYAFGGWTNINGQQAFLTTSGAIMADGHHPDIRVDLGDNNLRHYKLPAPPEDPQPAVQASLNFLKLAPLSVSGPLWTAMYTAPLGEFIHLNAVLWVYGGTQSLKSTLTLLALTHFGADFIVSRNHEYRAPTDWISTDTSIEGRLFAAKDLPFVIDDYAPQHLTNAEARNVARIANRVIRSVGNRSARGRALPDKHLSERVNRPPRGLVISTAELPMVGQSIEGRMIYVIVNKGDIPLSPELNQAQVLGDTGVYSQAMSAYVRWIARNWEVVQKSVELDYALADQHARTVFPSEQARLIDYYATLTCGLKLFLRFALETRSLTQSQAERLEREVTAALAGVLVSQGERIAQQSPALRFFEALSDLITQERICLAPRRAPQMDEKKFIPPLSAELGGWYGVDKLGQQRLYLLTNLCLQKVKEYWERVGESFDMLPDSLRRQLSQAGVLVQKDPRQFEPSLWIASTGQTQRVMVVDVAKVTALTGISPWPEKALQGEAEQDDY